MTLKKIYFRADGNSEIGLGHVIRSLALADILKNEFECHFIIRNPLQTLKEQILDVCKSIIILSETNNDIEEANQVVDICLTKEDIVVLDGYNFNTQYQKVIKNKGCKLVCVDDIHSYHFVADVVINHAGGVDKNKYSREIYTRIYLGLKFAILRKDFLEESKNRVGIEFNKNVFICFGGADPNNETLIALKKCEEVGNIDKCYVVLGQAFLHHMQLEYYLKKSSLNVKILNNLSAAQMVKYMKKCSRAITPPSTISYEYLSVGGYLFLKIIADNQRNINNYFLKKHLAFPLESFPLEDEELFNLSIKKQIEYFDGQSPKRFIKIFKSIS